MKKVLSISRYLFILVFAIAVLSFTIILISIFLRNLFGEYATAAGLILGNVIGCFFALIILSFCSISARSSLEEIIISQKKELSELRDLLQKTSQELTFRTNMLKDYQVMCTHKEEARRNLDEKLQKERKTSLYLDKELCETKAECDRLQTEKDKLIIKADNMKKENVRVSRDKNKLVEHLKKSRQKAKEYKAMYDNILNIEILEEENIGLLKKVS